MNTQKMLRRGMLEEKKSKLDHIKTQIKAKVDSLAVMIMPELDIEDQKFEYAEGVIRECVDLKTRYDRLKTEIRELEEAI